ncbi:hypothetical protein DC498_02525 [Terrimonas sp.]|uniref:hypothetical protein n=1 Tax=Terrimonas sp. TaxID=1914338 RepID=UPI000D51528C|nr:hypothetical protein [Terrimonas sp.]PVD54273.1 hypothetical protein DC498_02525 [Terrimonas sp.]
MKWLKFNARHIFLILISAVFGFSITKKSSFDRQAWFYPQKISRDIVKDCYSKNPQAYIVIQNKLRKNGGVFRANRPRFILKGFVFDPSCNSDTCKPICKLDFDEIGEGFNEVQVENTVGTGVYITTIEKLFFMFDSVGKADALYFIPDVIKTNSKSNKVDFVYYWVYLNKDKDGRPLRYEDVERIHDKEALQELKKRFNATPLNPSPPRNASKQ